VRQGGFAQTGRPVKQDVIERFAALASGVYEDLEILFYTPLADQVGKVFWAQGGVQSIIGLGLGVYQAFRIICHGSNYNSLLLALGVEYCQFKFSKFQE
jgi:hypothetical protein